MHEASDQSSEKQRLRKVVEEMTKTINVEDAVHQALVNMKRGNDTMNDIIKRLLTAHSRSQT